jgi:hypothetical protein
LRMLYFSIRSFITNTLMPGKKYCTITMQGGFNFIPPVY